MNGDPDGANCPPRKKLQVSLPDHPLGFILEAEARMVENVLRLLGN